MKDTYVYEGTSVLVNKLNIRDSKLLDEKEGAIVSLNIISIINNPITIKSVFDIKNIHKNSFLICMNGQATIEILTCIRMNQS